MEKMIKKYLGERLPALRIGEISEFASETVGANPRSIKRMVNSFLLLEIIQGKLHPGADANGFAQSNSKEESALLFCVLCIQAHYTPLYAYLSDTAVWEELDAGFVVEKGTPEDMRKALRIQLQTYSEEDFSDDRVLDRMVAALTGLDRILSLLYPKVDKQKQYEHLANVLRLSAVTGTGNTRPKSAGKGNAVSVKVIINGHETVYPAAATACAAVFEKLLQENPKRVSDCLRECGVLTDDSNRNNSVFRKKVEIEYSLDGVTKKVYLGLSTGNPEKRRQLRKLCRCLSLPSAYLRWEDNTGCYDLSEN